MRRPVVFLTVGLGVLALAAAQKPAERSSHDATIHHRFDDVEHWVREFESPERLSWQNIDLVIRLLSLEKGMTVADLGAGTGLFTRRMANIVGKEGRTYAVDIEPALLDYIRNRPDMPYPDRVVTVLADPDDPKLPEGALDLILCVNTWHHIDGRMKYLKKLAKALKPRGRFVLIDFREGELPVGPPAGMKLSRSDAVAEFEKAGWTRLSESVGFRYQYFIVFTPPG